MSWDEDETESFDNVEAKHETELALLCLIGGDPHWVPKSQIHEDSDVNEKGDEGTLVVKAWWAKKAGLV